MSWQDFYKHVTNPFGAKGPFYGPAGHHGTDFAVAAHNPVPAYFSGTCVFNGHSGALGNYSVFHADGAFLGYAHLLINTRCNVGQTINPGGRVGLAAGPNDDHGSAWSGPHCHTTRSPEINGIWDGNVSDPWPRIKALTAGKPSAARSSTRVRPGEGGIAVASRVGISFSRLESLNPGVNMSKLRLLQKLWTS